LITTGVLISSILHLGHEGINNVLPQGMKSCPTQFMRFPYYQDLKIVHLFDTMDIGNNLTKTLWQIIDSRRDKEKIFKICSDIQEANHAMQSGIQSNSDGYLNRIPWLLIEYKRNGVQEVIRRINFSTVFSSNINNILTKKGEFSGVKTHDFFLFVQNVGKCPLLTRPTFSI
jgi:hypothetical protein